ncbi:putative membrane protein [Mycobacterium intracellulare 1956]|uniref:Putative membrane protein n=1 Tax=Mycobacterium intracellulare 1956 TaxID=1299331 RepID=X8CRD8_MYCIT|nr:putative membrane protein [Mycobacterium intracellulare]EUA57795.1 putative membrane protein [Mycobacterium intracellulare 1956]
MGMLFGLAPWIVYWVLVGNVPFAAAVLVALAVAAAGLGLGGAAGRRWQFFDFASVAALLILTVLTFTLSQSFLERWLLTLSNAGILVVTLVGMLVGKPFVAEFAAAEHAPDVAKTELFGRVVQVLGWVWVATFAAMTVSSAVPSIVQRPAANASALILDTKTPLSFLCYWIIPFGLLGLAAVASRLLPDRMLAGIDDVARETSFVAYDEATIDELYFLAQEHANREVGPGKEAYAVKVGGMGTPLTGDESRKSWPSTYKVRDKRH